MGLFSRRRAAEEPPAPKPPPPAAVIPPVDLDVPVTNPELVAALVDLARAPRDEDMPRVLDLLRSAVLLVATRIDGPGVVDGVMQAGSVMTVYSVLLPDDRPALALVTDWPSLRASCGDGWSALVQAPGEGWRLARGAYAGGAVLNPAGPEVIFPLDPPRIDVLLAPGQG